MSFVAKCLNALFPQISHLGDLMTHVTFIMTSSNSTNVQPSSGHWWLGGMPERYLVRIRKGLNFLINLYKIFFLVLVHVLLLHHRLLFVFLLPHLHFLLRLIFLLLLLLSFSSNFFSFLFFFSIVQLKRTLQQLLVFLQA